jgi:hypothetical protein
MTQSPLLPARIAGFTLVAVAVSQVLFMALSGALVSFEAEIYWTVEALLYLAMAVAALLLANQAGPGQIAAVAIAPGALCNVIQLVIGLAMFAPLAEAGDDYRPVYDAVHAGAFAFYFTGKVLFGAAAIALGLVLAARGGLVRVAGAALAVAGTSALAVNAVALALGESLAFPAGITGTVAALGAGLALTAVVRGSASAVD